MQNCLSKILISLLLTCNVVLNSTAQNNLDTTSIPIPFTVYKTDNDTTSIESILKLDNLFQPTKNFEDKTLPKDTYWIKLDLKSIFDTSKSDSLRHLKFNNFGYGTLFSLHNNSIIRKIVGHFEADNEADLIKFHSEVSFSPNSLFQDRYLYLKVNRVISREYLERWSFSCISHTQHLINKNYSTHQDSRSVIPMYIFAGICIIMVLLTLAFYAYLKRLEFLFYSLYVFFLLILISGYELKIFNFLFGDNLLLKYWFYEVVQMFINSAYIFFVMFYLKTKEDYPLIQRLLKFMLVLQLLVFIIDSSFVYYKFFIGHIYIINIERLTLITSSTAGLIYLAFKGKNTLAYFIVFGLLFFLIGTIAHFYLTNGSALLEHKSRYYLMIGCIIDIIIFAYGLTYKFFQEQNEKLRYQQEALTQKNKALRAQINPHFIFNSLSSIQSFITSNDRVSALKYLSKFSRLTRNILESSIETNVVLNDEIKMLNDYLNLESLRFDNAFNFEISIDEQLNGDTIEIPFLILQPLVENAIIHGLLPKKEGEKTLAITFAKENDYMICEIDDNGIGRQASSKKKNIHKEHKKSRGMEVTIQRLQSLNIVDQESVIEIKDKADDNYNATGTKVIIKIPIQT